MLIELSKLEDGRGNFAHAYKAAELDLADERVSLAEVASVNGRIKQTSGKVLVEGTIDTAVEVSCDRCLKALRIPVHTEFSLDYIGAKDYQATHEAELAEEEMTVSVFDGEAIDIDEIVREQVLLSVPGRTLCTESCKGLCPTCGADLNEGSCSCESDEVDPRWAALKNLRTTD